MREQVDLGYRKIVRLAPHTNSKRCLISWQRCMMVFLKLLAPKPRFINIDE